MLKTIIGFSVFIAVFCTSGVYAGQTLGKAEENRYLEIIKKRYPSTDDRHKYAVAIQKITLLMEDDEVESIFSYSRIIPVLTPFLDSPDEKIRKITENLLTFVKKIFKVQVSTLPPNGASYEEVEFAKKRAFKFYDEAYSSHLDFIRSYVPENQWEKKLKDSK